MFKGTLAGESDAMREILEFRVPEGNAKAHLLDSDGVLLGDSVRKVTAERGSVLCTRILDLDRQYKSESAGKRSFYLGWDIRRTYSKQELNAAELFTVRIKKVFEPAGEERGTLYDDSAGCCLCGAGAVQKSPLVLDRRRIPEAERACIAKTIAGEIIVSRQFVGLAASKSLTGMILGPVQVRIRGRLIEVANWHQLRQTTSYLPIVPPTACGTNPSCDFERDRYECPNGDTLGLNLLSELTVRVPPNRPDVAFTEQFIGVRRGLLRPNRRLVVSARFRREFEQQGLRGLRFEVAHAGPLPA